MKLIAFDLDDTLYNERDFVASGYRAVSANLSQRYGLNYDEMVYVMTHAPLNPFDSLEEYLTNRSVQRGLSIVEDIPWMVKTYREHRPDIALSDEVVSTLAALIQRKYRLALITDGRVVTQSNKIESLGLSRFIDADNISISQAIGAEKYHRLPFRRMMDLNGDVESFAYVADNPMKDFVWPNRLGWTTVQLLDNGRNVHSQTIQLPGDDYRAQLTIDRFSKLLKIFK
jgi:putative hydrolase of the HAD superfamily